MILAMRTILAEWIRFRVKIETEIGKDKDKEMVMNIRMEIKMVKMEIKLINRK